VKLVDLSFTPTNAKEFAKFATLIVAQFSPYKGSFHYPAFMKELLKEATSQSDPEEVKELISVLNVIVNEKIKASNTKKKKGPKKPVKKEAVYEDMVEDDDEFSGFRM